jgi:integrase
VRPSHAVQLGILDRNPLADMKGPRYPRTEQRILDISEIRKLLAVGRNTEWYTLLYLASVTAMREAELFGLTWGNVNLKDSHLRVIKQLARTDNGYALTEPKTAASRRRVDLPKDARAKLFKARLSSALERGSAARRNVSLDIRPTPR